jgi:hypothetical protein
MFIDGTPQLYFLSGCKAIGEAMGSLDEIAIGVCMTASLG